MIIIVDGNASMYLGSPRMAEAVIGEHVTLEEIGGARMHATVSGCGDNLAIDDADAIAQARLLFSYLPSSWRALPDVVQPESQAQSSPAQSCPNSRPPGTTCTG